jgi:hypothetical protein
MKTDQEILEELKQAGGGERRRSFGLTAFIVLLAIIIGVFTYMNRKDETNEANNLANTNNTVATNNSTENNASNESTNETNESNAANEANETAANESNESAPSEESNQTIATPTNGEAFGEESNAQSTHSETAYTETAQVGEGVTHLARRAVHGYLHEKSISDLTAEHKVFVEDYLAKHAGSAALDIGNTQTFETSTIDQAIAAARALTPAQLQNLEQYSAQVPGL